MANNLLSFIEGNATSVIYSLELSISGDFGGRERGGEGGFGDWDGGQVGWGGGRGLGDMDGRGVWGGFGGWGNRGGVEVGVVENLAGGAVWASLVVGGGLVGQCQGFQPRRLK